LRFLFALTLHGAMVYSSVLQSSVLHAAPLAVNMRVVHVPGGPRMAVWYPEAHAAERFPLVLFSHGLDGCGTQSVFFTESLAAAGYVVAAPDHRDASCSVEGARIPRMHFPRALFTNPGRWTASTYADRRADLEKALDWILRSEDFGPMIDASRIGAAGHSLGGYSVLGLAGAWESWRDPRIGAVLVFAPYVKPFLRPERLASLDVPVMYQGAQFDLGITPSLRGPHGAFALSNAPKYYLELRRATHFEWTNGICWGHPQIAACLKNRANARLIVEYGVAFFDHYLKLTPAALETLDGQGLRVYMHNEAAAGLQ
jgi:predicted dienelactone hydrolase